MKKSKKQKIEEDVQWNHRFEMSMIHEKKPLFRWHECNKCKNLFKHEKMWKLFFITSYGGKTGGAGGGYDPGSGYNIYLCKECASGKIDAHGYFKSIHAL